MVSATSLTAVTWRKVAILIPVKVDTSLAMKKQPHFSNFSELVSLVLAECPSNSIPFALGTSSPLNLAEFH